MKPIAIEMSAFGPYKDTTKIDFEKIGKDGIFLITGDTGAGKTTIFDGIVFALYGTLSGTNRLVTGVRSDFANENTKTEVKLTFSHKGKNYLIIRNPQYERPSKRGEGTTKQPADASIENLETKEILATGIINVDKKVKEIIGIDVKQFKQISMLAQGEFIKILFADSKERMEIFRKIFDTYIYEKITFKLKEKADKSKKELETYKTKFCTNTKNIKWKEEPEFIKAVDEKNIHNYIGEIIDLLKEEVKKQKEDENNIDKELDEKQKILKEIETKYEKSIEINNKITKLENLKEIKQKLEDQKELYKEKESNLEINNKIQLNIIPKENEFKNKEKERNELKEKQKENNNKIDILNKEEITYREKDKQINEIKKLSEEKEINKQSKEKFQEEIIKIENIENIIKELEENKKQIEQAKEKENKIIKLKEEIEENKKETEELEKIKEEKKKINEIEKLYESREILSKSFEKTNNEFRILEDQYNKEEDKFYKEQAGILAETLEEDKPCPVCGSIHHPSIATRSKALSKEELNKLKIQKETKEKEKTIEYEKLTIETTKIETLTKDLKYNEEEITLNEYINKTNKEYENKKEKIENNKKNIINIFDKIENKEIKIETFDIEKYQEEFNETKRRIENEIEKRNILIENFKENMKETLSKEKDIEKYSNEVKTKYKEIEIKENELNSKISELCVKICNITIDINKFKYDEIKEKYDQDKKEYEENKTKEKTIKQEIEKQLEKNNKILEKIKIEFKETYNQLGFETEKEYKEKLLTETETKRIKEEINQYNKMVIETQTTIKELEENEKIKQQEKINTEEIMEQINKEKEEVNETKNIQIEIKGKLQQNKETLDNLKKDKEKVKEQIETYTTLDELSKLASGNAKGKTRIEFEQYVQAAYFDMIIIEANKRLIKMTGNRFELIRKENSNKLSDKIGLDLEVIDNYTGKRRDVKTLSGGESFKAALSLSLGVSDVIQSYSGGVVVDTLFVDEGFGSLDTESREQAIQTLMQLSSNNKLIGIISHVTELKDVIEKKIIVTKTTTGSKAEIE